MREYTINRYLRYYLIRIKDVFINWARNWWKIAEDGADCFACCDVCLRMCPECNDCHSNDLDSPFAHTGMYCPHRGYTCPEDIPAKMRAQALYEVATLKSLYELQEAS